MKSGEIQPLFCVACGQACRRVNTQVRVEPDAVVPFLAAIPPGEFFSQRTPKNAAIDSRLYMTLWLGTYAGAGCHPDRLPHPVCCGRCQSWNSRPYLYNDDWRQRRFRTATEVAAMFQRASLSFDERLLPIYAKPYVPHITYTESGKRFLACIDTMAESVRKQIFIH